MNTRKTHTHKCASEFCKQTITHLDDSCLTAKVLCNSCLVEHQAPVCGKVESEWEPFEDREPPQKQPEID